MIKHFFSNECEPTVAPPKKRARTDDIQRLQRAVDQGRWWMKNELAKALMDDGTEEDKAKAVSLAEECTALGDDDAMLTLAEWCTVGKGMDQDLERAKELISLAAEKGNEDAESLLSLINCSQEQETVNLNGLT